MVLGGRNTNDEIGGRNMSCFLTAVFYDSQPINLVDLVVGEKTFTMYSWNCHRKFS